MGHRTVSLALVFRALFLRHDAYEELREDDNPFVEGLFLVVLIAFLTALMQLVGQVMEWASVPRISDLQNAVLSSMQQQSWWQLVAGDANVARIFQGIWDASWQLFPALFGAPDPAAGALNLLVWPVWAVASWLLYGLLAHGFARLMYGQGTLNQTLGVTALAFTPWLLRGLEIVPFLVIGGVINTWQLILRYRALRVVHRLTWSSALWATVLPFAVYLAFWLLVAAGVSVLLAAVIGR
jgi:hypothetical protein